ncbi:class I SAM-dependent methyltransferase [Albidovulum sp.]
MAGAGGSGRGRAEGTGNAAQAAFWSSQPGELWARQHARIDALFSEITAALLARAALAPGMSVLDVGCGAGETSLAAARAVAPGGRVLGVDISPTLLAVARQRGAGVAGLDFVQADAQDHPFEPGARDLLLSRFGLMFFADPVAAFANLRAALRPGGRAVFVSWAAAAGNPWMVIPRAVGVERLGPVPADPPRTPGMFAFAEIDYVLSILGAAGFADLLGEEVAVNLHPAASVREAAEFATLLGPVSRIIRERGATEADREAIAGEIARRLAPFQTAEGVRVPARINLFCARNP